jgi:hypothetical protein
MAKAWASAAKAVKAADPAAAIMPAASPIHLSRFILERTLS